MNMIATHFNQVKQLCEANKVSRLFTFGSVITDEFDADSDIDFIVDIADNDPISYSNKYFDLKLQLEKLFERRIDLLEEKAISNPYLKARIENTKVLIYAR